MSRTALILAAHGSRHQPDVNEAIRRMAEALSLRLEFDEIVAAFHQGEPTFATVLDQFDADDVKVVPVMTSEGYYCDKFLPSELRKNRRFGAIRLRQTPPIGVHAEIAKLVRRRVQELLSKYGLIAARTTLIIVGHGTPRHPQSRDATETLTSTIRRDADFVDVVAAYLDDTPTVKQALALARSSDIIVVPFLIGMGAHAAKDIPRRLGMAPADLPEPPFLEPVTGRRVVCDRPIGADPRIIDVVAQLADSLNSRTSLPTIARRRALRLGTRSSAMALWQAEYVADQLRSRGSDVEIVELSTLGDRVRDRAICDLPGDAPFVQDIEEALLDGRIDIAVHCLKDMPICPTVGLQVAALLKRDEVAEALVSRDRIALRDLPAGAFVGTSSPRRAAQLLAIRPDLLTATIRGPVEDRIRQVRDGRFDATILAVAGLRRLGMMSEITEELPLDDFLPAPGQGALAIQVRAGDKSTAEFCSALDDAPSRLATTAELEFLRHYKHSQDPLAAAYALAERKIRLTARLISADGKDIRDAVVVGADPIDVAHRAIDQLHRQSRARMLLRKSGTQVSGGIS